MNITLSADVVVFRRHPMRNTDTEVLLIKRPRSPSAGYWALPGGNMSEQDVTLEETARRTIQEETGMVLDPTKYELHLVGSTPTPLVILDRSIRVWENGRLAL